MWLQASLFTALLALAANIHAVPVSATAAAEPDTLHATPPPHSFPKAHKRTATWLQGGRQLQQQQTPPPSPPPRPSLIRPPATEVTVVNTAEELHQAVTRGDTHVEIQDHLVLTSLQPLPAGLLGYLPATVKSIRVRPELFNAR